MSARAGRLTWRGLGLGKGDLSPAPDCAAAVSKLAPARAAPLAEMSRFPKDLMVDHEGSTKHECETNKKQ